MQSKLLQNQVDDLIKSEQSSPSKFIERMASKSETKLKLSIIIAWEGNSPKFSLMDAVLEARKVNQSLCGGLCEIIFVKKLPLSKVRKDL